MRDLDLVVVAAGHDQRLDFVEVDATNWAVVLVKALQKNTHAAFRDTQETGTTKHRPARQSVVCERVMGGERSAACGTPHELTSPTAG